MTVNRKGNLEAHVNAVKGKQHSKQSSAWLGMKNLYFGHNMETSPHMSNTDINIWS